MGVQNSLREGLDHISEIQVGSLATAVLGQRPNRRQFGTYGVQIRIGFDGDRLRLLMPVGKTLGHRTPGGFARVKLTWGGIGASG